MVGDSNELKEMVKDLDGDQLQEFCGERSVNWILTTPAAPHQNRCVKALVKSSKRSLKIAIDEQLLTPFELYTCLLEIANLLNQRLIGRIPSDPEDGAYLCPNDMVVEDLNVITALKCNKLLSVKTFGLKCNNVIPTSSGTSLTCH